MHNLSIYGRFPLWSCAFLIMSQLYYKIYEINVGTWRFLNHILYRYGHPITTLKAMIESMMSHLLTDWIGELRVFLTTLIWEKPSCVYKINLAWDASHVVWLVCDLKGDMIEDGWNFPPLTRISSLFYTTLEIYFTLVYPYHLNLVMTFWTFGGVQTILSRQRFADTFRSLKHSKPILFTLSILIKFLISMLRIWLTMKVLILRNCFFFYNHFSAKIKAHIRLNAKSIPYEIA